MATILGQIEHYQVLLPVSGMEVTAFDSTMATRRQLEPEEIEQIANKEWKTKVPKKGVVYEGRKLNTVVQNLTGPKTKRGKANSVSNLRPFISNEEKDEYFKEFGPYANALINDDEREYFKRRRDEILNSDEFNLDPILDLHIVMICVMDEIILQRLLKKQAEKPSEKKVNDQITQVQKRYRENLKVLDATREQRNAAEREDKRTDSLAQLVYKWHTEREQMLELEDKYAREEEELQRRLALKAPPEIEYMEGEVIDAELIEAGGDEDYNDTDNAEG